MVDAAAAIEPGGEVKLARQVDMFRRHHEMAEAEAAARDAVRCFPNAAAPLVALGRVLLATQRAAEAARVFSRAEQVARGDDHPTAWRIAALSRQRLYGEAIELGDDALDRFPRSALIRVALGRVFLDSGRPGQAMQYFVDGSAVDPNNVTAISWHAACHAEMHQWAEAKSVIRGVIERDPGQIKAQCRLGRILVSDGCFDEAIGCFDAVLGCVPEHRHTLQWRITALRRLRRFQEADEFATDAIRRLPHCPLLHVEHAWVASDQDQEDEAVTRVERALAIDPRNATALRDRIQFLRWGRRFEEAEQAVMAAIELRPDDPDIHAAAAVLWAGLERYDSALSSIERALAIDPRNATALRDRIQFLRLARRFEQAEQAAAQAIELRPDDPDIHAAAAWVASNQDQQDEAVTRVERALAIDPRNATALRSRIQFLRLARRFEQAEQAATAAIELRPDDPDIHTTAAWVASDQDQQDEAVTRVERALAIDPRNATALRSRIEVLRLARRFEQAEQAATAAIELRPDHPDIHTTAAWVASDQDQQDEAVTRVERALAIDPRNATALRDRIQFLRLARRFEQAEQAATG